MWLLANLLAALVLAFAYWRFIFFLRDPHRTIPADERLVLAPADGYITYIRRVSAGQVSIAIKGRRTIPLTEIQASGSVVEEEGYLIGTFMTAFSVHRNRIPLSGEVTFRHHQPAPRNLTMARLMTNLLLGRRPYETDCEFLVLNERLTIGIRTAAGAVVTVTQIADAWVDRIIARVEVGDLVERGDQYGLIRFGSQVDVFLPCSLVGRILVEPGEYVRAGESALVSMPRSGDGTPLPSVIPAKAGIQAALD